jgi:arylsulfatase A
MLHNGVEHWHTGTKGVFRGAKATSYEGGSRVPGIARWPGVIAPRQVNMDIASTLDFFPTLVTAAGAEMPADRVYDGYDILPTMKNGAKSPRDTFYYVLGAKLEAVREGPWKYRNAGEPELFHIDDDPAEQYNRYADNRQLADRLAAKLKSFATEIKAE